MTTELNIKKLIVYIVMILAFLLLIYKCFLGFDWSDETYYSALSYRFFLGDPIFLAAWDIHQTSAIITLPLISLYVLLTGNTDGIILFLRIVFTVSQFFLTLYSFRIMKKFINQWGALFASLLFMITPFCIRTFSYNTLPMLFLPLAFFLLIGQEKCMSKLSKCIFSGISTALAVLSYPPVILVIPVFLVYLFLAGKQIKSTILKYMFAYLAGGFIVVIGFLIFVMFNSSISNMLDNYHYMLFDPEHSKGFSFIEFFDGIVSAIGGIKMAIIILLMTLIAAVCSFIPRFSKKYILYSFLIVTAIIIVILEIINIATTLYATNMIPLIIAVFAPMLFFMSGRKKHFSILLYVIGLCFSLGVNIGSNNGMIGASFPLLLSDIAIIIYVFSVFPYSEYRSTFKTVILVPFMLLVCVFFYFNITSVYRDEPLKYLTTRMEHGPASGIYTTENNAKKYEGIIKSIETYLPTEGHVLYSKLLPFGYLCGKLTPATPRLWRTNLDYYGFSQYYINNPDHKPTFIFIVDEEYGVTNGDIIWGEYLQSYLKNNDYEKIHTEFGSIYILKN